MKISFSNYRISDHWQCTGSLYKFNFKNQNRFPVQDGRLGSYIPLSFLLSIMTRKKYILIKKI